jgi:protein subunit release factor A
MAIFFVKTNTMKINLEIRDAEGGADAKLLVCEMRDIYIKTAKINNIN